MNVCEWSLWSIIFVVGVCGHDEGGAVRCVYCLGLAFVVTRVHSLFGF